MLPSPVLDVRDLRVVLAIAAVGSTARAADELHLTQPAVSRALLSVEDRLATRLFERNARGLAITPAGERLVASAGRILLDLTELERQVSMPAQVPARLRIVCQCYTAYRWLPSTLAALRRSLPDLALDLAIEHTSDPVAALLSGEVDAALLTTAGPCSGGLEEAKLFSDEVVCVLAPTHPLASQPWIKRSDLASQPLVSTVSPAAEDAWFMRKVFGRRRVKLDMQRIPLTEAVLDVVRAGMAIGILSEWIVRPHLSPGDLQIKRIDVGALQRPWRLAWRKEVRGPARRLRTALQATAPRA